MYLHPVAHKNAQNPAAIKQSEILLELLRELSTGRFFPFASRVLHFERMLSDTERVRLRSGTLHAWYVAAVPVHYLASPISVSVAIGHRRPHRSLVVFLASDSELMLLRRGSLVEGPAPIAQIFLHICMLLIDVQHFRISLRQQL